MGKTAFVPSTDWILLVTLAGVYLLTAVIPAIWLTARKGNLDRFVRVWHPIAVFLTAVSGIAVSQDSWSVKLILVGVAAPVSALGGYLGYLLYSWLRHSPKLP